MYFLWVLDYIQGLGEVKDGQYQWASGIKLNYWSVLARDVAVFFADYNDDLHEYLNANNRSVPVHVPQPSNCVYPS